MSIRCAELDFSHSLVAGPVSLLFHAGPPSCATDISLFPPAPPPIRSCPNREIEAGAMSEYATEAGIVVLRGEVRTGLFWTKTCRIYWRGVFGTEKIKCRDPEAGAYLWCLRGGTEVSETETVSWGWGGYKVSKAPSRPLCGLWRSLILRH